MQMVPCGWHNPQAVLFLGPGSVIDLDILRREIAMVSEYTDGRRLRDRLWIDRNAAIITPAHQEAEASLKKGIGSTGKGVGAAQADRVMRSCMIAADVDFLRPYLTNVADQLHERAGEWHDIVVESTQGYGLSLTRSGHYPFVTSRDITPAAILNEAGIPHNWPLEVIAVFRTMPIRVAGNSGPLSQETDWKTLAGETGGYIKEERTTVTNNIRRVGRWDPQQVKDACRHIQPDGVHLSFVDYIMPEVANRARLLPSELDQLRTFQDDLDAPIRWIGTGFGHIIELTELETRILQRVEE